MNDAPIRLRPPRHPVDTRCVLWWRLHALALTVPLTLVGLGIAWISRATWVLVAFAALLALTVTYVVVMPSFRFRIHRWEVTDEAVYTKSGWLTQQWRVAPLSRIQSVDSSRGPLQQLLGLSTVVVTTASAMGSLDISALDDGLAQELVEYLTSRTQQTPEDGT